MCELLRLKALSFWLTFFIIFVFSAPHNALAYEPQDRYLSLREDEIKAKQRRSDEVAVRIDDKSKQVSQERKRLRQSREKIYRDFMEELEVERINLKDQLEVIQDRQRLFEVEFEKKQNHDALRLKERDQDLQRLMLELDRLRAEIQEDGKLLKKQRKDWKKSRFEVKQREMSPPVGAEKAILENGKIKITGMSGHELFGSKPFHLRIIRTEYYVEIGDVLGIDVWRVPDLTRTVTVRPDGRISLPLVGDLDVLGESLTEIRDILTEKFKEYVIDPQVLISIRQFGGRKFIILGEVKGPGVYRYQQDISLLEAIALSGGLTKDAKRGQVMIIRGDIRKQPVLF